MRRVSPVLLFVVFLFINCVAAYSLINVVTGTQLAKAKLDGKIIVSERFYNAVRFYEINRNSVEKFGKMIPRRSFD